MKIICVLIEIAQNALGEHTLPEFKLGCGIAWSTGGVIHLPPPALLCLPLPLPLLICLHEFTVNFLFAQSTVGGSQRGNALNQSI